MILEKDNNPRGIKKILLNTIYYVRPYIPTLDFLFINYAAKCHGNVINKFKPVSFIDYCKSKGGTITIVEEEQERVVCEPAFYNKSKGKEYSFKVPPIYIAELKNVYVHGGSGLVLTGQNALTDVCVNDKENRTQYFYDVIWRANKKAFYIELSKSDYVIDCAINLCGLAASNYYHLTIEILSRFEYVKQYLKGKKVPVLLDEESKKFPQFEEIIKCVLLDYEIIYVPKCEQVFCKNLIQPSMNTWMPINVKRRDDFRISDNVVSLSGIMNIRKAANDYMRNHTGKKIFISRKNSRLSRLVNEKEILERFIKHGYEVVCTEDLSYRQQVEMFSSAKCVVAASGAALTNLVYCRHGAVFGCIIPKKYNFCIYSSIAHLVGMKMLYFDAKVVKRGIAFSLDQYKAEISACDEYIEELEKLIESQENEKIV